MDQPAMDQPAMDQPANAAKVQPAIQTSLTQTGIDEAGIDEAGISEAGIDETDTSRTGTVVTTPAETTDLNIRAAAERVAAARALELNVTRASVTKTGRALVAAGDVLNLSPTLAGAVVDLPSASLRAAYASSPLDRALTSLDGRDAQCTAGPSLCEQVASDRASLGVGGPVNVGGVAGLDLELEPRAAMRFGEDDSALVGAVVRIGDDLKNNGAEPTNSWYLFAGADAEAMTYAPDSATAVTSGRFGLQDRIIVGDAQAGIGYRIGESADVSLGYIRREVKSLEDNDPTNDISVTEDAAALSFTWRR